MRDSHIAYTVVILRMVQYRGRRLPSRILAHFDHLVFFDRDDNVVVVFTVDFLGHIIARDVEVRHSSRIVEAVHG